MGGIPLQSLGDSLVDTGTSVNVFPTSVVTAIQAQLQTDTAFATVFGSTAFGEIFGASPTCASTVNGLTIEQVNTQLPPLTFTFASSGGGTFSLSVPATGAYLRVTAAGGVQYYCNGMMDAAQAGLPSGLTGLLGKVFLNAFVTIFDVQNKQLGFAPLTGCD